jgi:hypothetical protein
MLARLLAADGPVIPLRGSGDRGLSVHLDHGIPEGPVQALVGERLDGLNDPLDGR